MKDNLMSAQAWFAITKRNPSDAAAFACLGVVLSKQQKYAEAAKAYRKAIALNPGGDPPVSMHVVPQCASVGRSS